MTPNDLIIFDLDGTLIDSQEDIADAAIATMQHLELPAPSRETIRRHIGTGVRPFLRALFEAADDARAERAMALFDEFYAARSTAKTRAYPGIVEMLSQLGGTTKVILTNKSSFFVDPILAGLDLGRYFAAAYGREAFPEAKPSRLPIDTIIERFGAARERCVIVGDTPVDILAGKAAGIATCGVLYGYGDPDAVRGAKPDTVVERSADLLSILG
jgi:phosphoglycolate phosphatase